MKRSVGFVITHQCPYRQGRNARSEIRPHRCNCLKFQPDLTSKSPWEVLIYPIFPWFQVGVNNSSVRGLRESHYHNYGHKKNCGKLSISWTNKGTIKITLDVGIPILRKLHQLVADGLNRKRLTGICGKWASPPLKKKPKKIPMD